MRKVLVVPGRSIGISPGRSVSDALNKAFGHNKMPPRVNEASTTASFVSFFSSPPGTSEWMPQLYPKRAEVLRNSIKTIESGVSSFETFSNWASLAVLIGCAIELYIIGHDYENSADQSACKFGDSWLVSRSS